VYRRELEYRREKSRTHARAREIYRKTNGGGDREREGERERQRARESKRDEER